MKIIDEKIEIANFDVKKTKIKEYFLSKFKEKSFQQVIENNENHEIYKVLYGCVNDKKFQLLYHSLLKIVSKHLNFKKFLYQKIPSFRIHRTNDKSVNFHNDLWYGHGEEVINVWLPLTNTNKYNALWTLDFNKSNNLSKLIKKKKFNTFDINNITNQISKPHILSYGKILFFNTSSFHGTNINKSTKHRLSFDFRILKHNKSSGFKSKKKFYLTYPKEQIKKQKLCLYYFYQKNFFLKNLDHSLQRDIIDLYCGEKNFTPNEQTTEIHGLSYYPHLFYYLRTKKYKNIVMTSILCLPSDSKTRTEILKLAKKNKINIHYALESIQNVTNNKINDYYKKFTKIYKNL